MTTDIRQVSHPQAVKRFDTAELRRHFLIEGLFRPGTVNLTYSHIDRLVVGGAPRGRDDRRAAGAGIWRRSRRYLHRGGGRAEHVRRGDRRIGAHAGEPGTERRDDAALNGAIEVSVDLEDETLAGKVRSAFAEFDAGDVEED